MLYVNFNQSVVALSSCPFLPLSAVCVASGIVITLVCVTLLKSLQFVMQFCFTKFCIFNKEYFMFLAHQRLCVTACLWLVVFETYTFFETLCRFSIKSNFFLLVDNNGIFNEEASVLFDSCLIKFTLN